MNGRNKELLNASTANGTKNERMKIQCPKCLPAEGIECPELSATEKSELQQLIANRPLQSIIYLRERYKLSLRDAKYITMHINKAQGHCNRCNCSSLTGENIHCPQCGAFNFNWHTAAEGSTPNDPYTKKEKPKE